MDLRDMTATIMDGDSTTDVIESVFPFTGDAGLTVYDIRRELHRDPNNALENLVRRAEASLARSLPIASVKRLMPSLRKIIQHSIDRLAQTPVERESHAV